MRGQVFPVCGIFFLKGLFPPPCPLLSAFFYFCPFLSVSHTTCGKGERVSWFILSLGSSKAKNLRGRRPQGFFGLGTWGFQLPNLGYYTQLGISFFKSSNIDSVNPSILGVGFRKNDGDGCCRYLWLPHASWGSRMPSSGAGGDLCCAHGMRRTVSAESSS